jgi:hypothetical protein
VVYLCEIRGGEIRPSHEVISARYWQISDVPAWHQNHEQLARAGQRAWEQRLQGPPRPRPRTAASE